MRQTWGWQSALIIAAALPSFAAAAPDAPSEVVATGQAALVGTDTAQARDKAIDDALRKAVEQAVGTLVSAETVTQNYELLSDKIYSKSKGYVRNYKIVSEGKKGDVYEVQVKAEVAAGDLSKDVDGILSVLRAKNMPRVLVMVSEQNVGQATEAFWWGDKNFSADLDVVENTIIDQWIPKGVRFVDRQALMGKLKVAQAMSSAAPSDSAVKEFAGKAGAEVVIIGKAFARDVGAIMGTQMHSIRANISVRALNVDNGQIMGTSTTSQAVGHIDPATGGTQALKKVAEKAAEELLAKILAQWQGEVDGTATVSLVLNNIKGSKNLRALSSAIGELRGVTDVRQRSFGNKTAELEVDLKGSSQDLAAALEDKALGGMHLEVEAVTPNTVTAAVK